MASGITLKVSPDALTAKAGQITSEISAMERELRALESVIAASTGYWTGDASARHQKYYRETKDDMAEVIKRLKEHPVELLKMAELYEKGEARAVEIANVLPKDVIS